MRLSPWTAVSYRLGAVAATPLPAFLAGDPEERCGDVVERPAKHSTDDQEASSSAVGMFEKPRQFAVVLSDIHIGNNAPTCWYQDRVHFDRLEGVLRWIVARRESVREVIFLGDTFDFWTYEPARQPPVMSEIIAANPRLLGAGGPLAQLVTALPGRVRLLPGNHDENLTPADIAQLNPRSPATRTPASSSSPNLGSC